MRATQHSALLFVIIYSLSGIPLESAEPNEKHEAFARAFGYVRFFHPSDAVAEVDWNQMALYGAEETILSPETETTEALLLRLFDPLVTDLELYRGEAKPLAETKALPIDQVIAWQHFGVGLDDSGRGMYRSIRTNRWKPTLPVTTQALFGNLLQVVDARELRGEEIRLRFKAKMNGPNGRLQGWFRIDREAKEMGLFDNMQDRPITKREWLDYELAGTVDEDANQLTFGFMHFGKASGCIDDVVLEKRSGDAWKSIDIGNGDFEAGTSAPDRWTLTTRGYEARIEVDDVAEGKQAVKLGAPPAASERGDYRAGGILQFVPELGEVVDASLSGDLRIRMPLVFEVDAESSFEIDAESRAFIDRVEAFSTERTDVLALGNVAAIWTAMQHFYPYFDQIETDWDEALTVAIRRALDAEDRGQCTEALQWLVAQLDDGHGRVIDPAAFVNVRTLPIAFDWIEDKLVVVASEAPGVTVGDIVIEFNGVAAKEKLTSAEALIAGSPQWKRYRSTSELSLVQGDDAVELRLDRDGEAISVSMKPVARRAVPTVERPEVVDVLKEGKENGTDTVYYVDLGRAEPADVDPMIDKFARAKGIVFDLRGYPRGTQYLFQHISDSHMQSAKWLIPQQIRPDRAEMANFDQRGRWEMPPREPRFRGECVFITNGSAISYAESCMAIVANYQLGEIIGSRTAGANGNINPFPLAGDYRVIYTGMRVINHDDSQHHVRGVRPTIPMRPTVQGIRDGRDELLEQALQLIEAGGDGP
ncbi:MAG: S41 family peptidase [Planctomycetota bacterium]